jgi:hypothetical protein
VQSGEPKYSLCLGRQKRIAFHKMSAASYKNQLFRKVAFAHMGFIYKNEPSTEYLPGFLKIRAADRHKTKTCFHLQFVLFSIGVHPIEKSLSDS